MAQRPYKAPVFAVFPFEPPDVFLYPRPDYAAAPPEVAEAVRALREEQARGISVKKRARKAARKGSRKAKREK